MHKLLHYFYSKTDVILEPCPGLFENFRLGHFKVSEKNISIWKFLEKDIRDPRANIYLEIVEMLVNQKKSTAEMSIPLS